MNYIITAKNIRDATHTDPLHRTEICTELIMPRLQAIHLLNTGAISKQDAIVTRIDRKCLYQNLFDNVVDWTVFAEQKVMGEVIDLVSCIYELDVTIPYKPFYQRYERDKEQIHNIALSNLDRFNIQEPFICLLNRKTPNHPEKNLPDDYWAEFLHDWYRFTAGNSQVFTFGDAVQDAPRNVTHIDSFQDWCSLLAQSNCKCVVSTASGGVYPIFFCGHQKSQLIVIDNNQLILQHMDSPSFYNSCINFTGATITVLIEIPNVRELISKIYWGA